MLLGAAMVQAAALIGFAALPGDAALAVIIALAALTGAAQPPLGATVRSLWARDLDEDTRHVLFTGESAVLEGIYIAGPVMIVAGIGGLLSISAAALACGVFTLVGTVLFVLTRASRAWRPEPDRVRGLAGALASPGVRTLLATMGVLGVGIGVIEVAVPALCERADAPSATGFVFGLWGLGSLVGGAVASRLNAGPDPGRRVIVLLAALACGTLPLVLAAGVVSLGALIFLAGIAIAPALAAVHSLAGRLAARARSPRPTRGSAPAWARASRPGRRSAARWSRDRGPTRRSRSPRARSAWPPQWRSRGGRASAPSPDPPH